MVCEEGFIKTQGADTITCHLEEGKVMWSGLIPKCEGTDVEKFLFVKRESTDQNRKRASKKTDNID